MTPTQHVVLGGVASAALYPVLGNMSLVFWVSSILIDLDHYVDYVYNNRLKDLSFARMFEYHDALERYWHSPAFLNVEAFHTIEFLAPLFLVAWYTGSAALQAACWGFVFHVGLDMMYMAWHGIFFKRAYSFTEYFIRKWRLKRKGWDPALVCAEAVSIVRERAEADSFIDASNAGSTKKLKAER